MVIPCEELSFGFVKDPFHQELPSVTHRIVGVFEVETLHYVADYDVGFAACQDVQPAAEQRMEEQGVLLGNAKLVGNICPQPNHQFPCSTTPE